MAAGQVSLDTKCVKLLCTKSFSLTEEVYIVVWSPAVVNYSGLLVAHFSQNGKI